MTTQDSACERCGNFGALTLVWGKSLCDDCRLRRPIDEAQAMSVGSLLSEALQLARRLGMPMVAAAIGVGFASALLHRSTHTVAATGFWRSSLIDMVITAFSIDLFDSAVIAIVVTKLSGAALDPWSSARNVIGRRFGTLAIFNFVSSLASFLAMMCLFVPMLAVYTVWSLALPILLFENHSLVGSTHEGIRRTHGHFGTILVACSIALFVPFVTSIAQSVVFPMASNAARDILGNFGLSALSHVIALPSTCLAAVLFSKLAPTQTAINAAPSQP